MLNEILSRLHPVQIFGRYLRLKPSGKSYKALCPFHNDKAPSFHIHPQTGLWFCFGCNKGGNLVQFVMAMEHLTFSDAMAILAKEAGMEWKPSGSASRTTRLLSANNLAAEFYHKILVSTERGQRFQEEYLIPRGIDSSLTETFRLGFAPDEPDRLYRWALQKGFTQEELLEAGLVQEKEGRWFDRFRYRLLFPICDAVGRTTGFAGRAIRATDEPKYLNTPQTPIFDKGKTLYGLSHARTSIAQKNFAILVEGYPDVLILHKFNFHQAVASMGTSLTRSQVRLLRNYSENVFIAFDPDVSGLDAALRSIQLFLAEQVHPRIVELPEGKDPDEFVLQRGASAFQSALDSSLPFLDFVIQRLLQKYPPQNAQAKKQFLQEFFPFLHASTDPILQDEYLNKLSSPLKISIKTIQASWAVFQKTPNASLPPNALESRMKHREELQLLTTLLEDPDLIGEIQKTLQGEDFSYPALQSIYQAFCSGKRTIPGLIDFFSEHPEESQILSQITTDPELLPLSAQETFAVARWIKKQSLDRRIQKMKEEYEQANISGNRERLQQLREQYFNLIQLRNRLHSSI